MYPQPTCIAGQNELVDCSGNQATVRQCDSTSGNCASCTSTTPLVVDGGSCTRNGDSAFQTSSCGSAFKAPNSAFSVAPALFLIVSLLLAFL
jgi:hypothetical protein